MKDEQKRYQEYFQNPEEIEGLTALLSKWDCLSENLGSFPPKARLLLPDLLLVSESNSMTSRMLRGLVEYLQAAGNLMEFYGEVSFFEFMLDYCPPTKEFTEIQRFMDEVTEYAGFRNVFKGVIHIHADAWLGHQEERYFLDFMDYLAESTSYWLIVMSVGNKYPEKISSFESMVSMFLRIEKLVIHMASTKSCMEELSGMIRQYGFKLDQEAESMLEESIDILRKSRYFDASYTMGLLCSDIVYEVYSHKLRNDRIIKKEDLVSFSADSDYVRRTLKRIEEGRTIGFIK